jgi:hypothetical protein
MEPPNIHLPAQHPAAVPEPARPTHLPLHAQWLAGTGAGSWFALWAEATNATTFRVVRYAPDGKIECDRLFTATNQVPDLTEHYLFGYPSHCSRCTLIQGNARIQLLVNER